MKLVYFYRVVLTARIVILVLSVSWFQEASPSQVASAATLSVAFMEALSTLFQSFTHEYKWV